MFLPDPIAGGPVYIWRAEDVAEPIAVRAVEATICNALYLLVGKANMAEDLAKTYLDYGGTTAGDWAERKQRTSLQP